MALLGLVAWMAGAPFLFPSLGPTAYLLGYSDRFEHTARVVIGGHLCGILGGLASYHLIAGPATLMQLGEAFSASGLALAGGAVAAVTLTVFLMLIFNASHPPACATTLIISLGILPEWTDAVIILVAVTIIYLAYLIWHRVRKKIPSDIPSSK